MIIRTYVKVVLILLHGAYIALSQSGTHFTCSFTKDHCGWKNNKYWKLSNGKTVAIGDGYYTYLDDTNNVAGVSAIIGQLESPEISTSNHLCVSFSYHVRGTNLGSLGVYLREKNSQNRNYIWKTKAPHGLTAWKFASLYLKDYKSPKGVYQIGFEATRPKNVVGQFAIKDIFVNPCNGAYHCSFDYNTCGWRHDDTADFRWDRHKGTTLSTQTGPATDKSGNGYYMYMEATLRHAGEKARLESPNIPANQPKCFSFWYNMYGMDIGELNVYIRSRGYIFKIVWNHHIQTAQKWYPLDLDVRHYIPENESYLIGFEAIRGSGFQSDIAIDEFQLIKCQGPKPNITSGTIYKELETCTFDGDKVCLWRMDSKIKQKWKKNSGSTSSYFTGPDRDVSGTGHYLYVEASSPRVGGDVARIESPSVYSAPSKCLNFWYHMKGSDIGVLRAFIRNPTEPEGNSRTVWSKSGHQGDKWFSSTVPLYNVTQTTSVIVAGLEAVMLKGHEGDIAIDEIGVLTCQGESSCTFDDDVCNWQPAVDTAFYWERVQPYNHRATKVGPFTDHTGNGSYITVLPTNNTNNKHAVLESQHFYVIKNRCLYFWYTIYGNNPGSLSVHTREATGPPKDRKSVKIWSRNASQIFGWHEGVIKLDNYWKNENGLYIISFHGMRNKGVGEISIDDVSVSECPIDSYDCTFDQNSCGWTNDVKADFTWQRAKGHTLTSKTGPETDHSGKGYYMYIEVSSPQKKGDIARLESPTVPAYAPKCMTFWYSMSGDQVGTLNAYVRTVQNTRYDLWSLSNDQGTKWLKGEVDFRSKVNPQDTFLVGFEGKRGDGVRGDIAIDDITFVHCSTISNATRPPSTNKPVTPKKLGLITCSFDIGFCPGWSMDMSLTLQWQLHRGNTPSLGTGPSSDISGSGNYIYIEATGKKQGNFARIESPVVYSKRPQCLDFWYHMAGRHIFKLSVYVRQPTSAMKTRVVIWTRYYSLSSRWYKRRIELEKSVKGWSSFVVGFEGYRGVGYMGDIALDAINITACSNEYNCNFDKSFCGWSHDDSVEARWVRRNDSTVKFINGPASDHTSSSGYYLLAPTQFLSPGDLSRIESPSMKAGSPRCLEFWYFMNGKAGTLKVDVKDPYKRNLWTMSGSQGAKWQRAFIDFRSTVLSTSDFLIIFQARKGPTPKAAIALDDIKFSYCAGSSLAPVSTITVPTVTAMVIKSLTCNFDLNFCGWSHENTANFNWSRNRGKTQTRHTGPSSDHTGSGHYIYIESSSPRSRDDVARLESPIIFNMNYSCLSFWYHMYGRHIGQLQVYLRSPVDPMYMRQDIWTLTGNQGNVWKETTLEMRNYTKNYNKFIVGFEGKRGSSYRGDIALDDIKITKCEEAAFCNFDVSLCGWTLVNHLSTYRWFRISGKTKSANTGPSADHTGNGYYIYAEGSSPSFKGEKTRIESPTIRLGKFGCFSFWYHMWGQGMGDLVVYITTLHHSKVWSASRDQGNTWKKAVIDLRWLKDTKFIIQFEAVRGASYTSDIAIDDVGLTYCKGLPTVTGSTAMMTTPTRETASLKCDFEKDFCGWMHDNQDNFNWTRTTGRTASYLTGPSKDHTTGSGYYVYIEASLPQQPGEKARLQSPPILRKPSLCLTFWYHMYGDGIGVLNVYINSFPSPISQRRLIWSLSGPQGDEWKLAVIDLDLATINMLKFVVGFEGIRGDSYSGDIALDDVNVDTCKVKNVALNQSVTEKQPSRWARVGRIVNGNTNTDASRFCYSKSGYSDSIWVMIDLGQTYNISRMTIYSPGERRTGVYVRGQRLSGLQPAFMMNSGFQVYITNQKDSWNSKRYLCYDHTGTAKEIMTLTCQSTMYGRYVYLYKSFQKVNQLGLCEVQVYGELLPSGFTLPPVTTPPVDGQCTFEHGWCGWVGMSVNWKRHIGPSTLKYGPKDDHSGKGYYVMSTGYGRLTSVLTSPRLSNMAQNKHCFSFWYYKNGHAGDHLNVYVRTYGMIRKHAWSMIAGKHPQWNNGIIDMRNYVSGNQKYNILFQSTFPTYSMIALDDFSFIKCPPSLGCNFDHDMCGWVNSGNTAMKWTRQQGHTPTSQTGPSSDHTGKGGWYVFIESSLRQNVVARLESPSLSVNDSLCMTFWYHMYGKDIGYLGVYVKSPTASYSQRKTVFKVSGDQGNVWLNATIDLPKYLYGLSYYQVGFEGDTGTGNEADIALDDITFFKCSGFTAMTTTPSIKTTKMPIYDKNNPYGCSFDQSECLYTHDDSAHFKWSRNNGSTKSIYTGPSSDHSGSGHYMYTEASNPRKLGDTARIESPLIKSSQPLCIVFWYHMFGNGIGNLTVYFKTQYSGIRNYMWHKSGNQGNVWRRQSIRLQKYVSLSQSYVVGFEGTSGTTFRGDIAIDDIVVQHCSDSYNCNFDFNLCGWSHDDTGNITWNVNYGATASRNTGPKTDHSGNGSYIYIEASYPVLKGVRARIETPLITNVSYNCVDFWYHMWGNGIGQLSLYVKDPASLRRTYVWKLNGNQGNQWKNAVVYFGDKITSMKDFFVGFEGIRGNNYRGDIALDSVIFTHCKPPTTVAPTTVTTTVNPQGHIPCSFDIDECGWKHNNSGSANFHWTRTSGGTKSWSTGPIHDHTGGNGSYMYLEASYPRKPGDWAELYSPVISSSQELCFDFWYHMYGTDIGKLSISTVLTSTQNPAVREVWSASGNKGNQWHYQAVHLIDSHFYNDYRIQIIGTRGKGFRGDIAIDDVRLYPCLEYPTCDFDNDYCGWMQKDKYLWKRSDGNSSTGPTRDHTGGGYYAYIQNSKVSMFNRARLESSPIFVLGSMCVEFWYYMSGNRVGSLALYTNKLGGDDSTAVTAWNTSGSMGNVWNKKRVRLMNDIIQSEDYVIGFEGISRYGFVGDIALDDVYLSSCADDNVALYKNVTTHSGNDGYEVVDSYHDSCFIDGPYSYPWLQVDLGDTYNINGISMDLEQYYCSGAIRNQVQKKDFPCYKLMNGFEIYVSDKSATWNNSINLCHRNIKEVHDVENFRCSQQMKGRYVTVYLPFSSNKTELAVCEITVYGDQKKVVTYKPPSSYNCSFDRSTCGWKNDPKADFLWSRTSGSTQSKFTGPKTDHSGKGMYMFIETSFPQVPGQVARLERQIWASNQSLCMTFWYHMYGGSIGSLRVIVKSVKQGTAVKKAILWTLSGDQGNQWLKAKVTLIDAITYNQNFIISFEAVRGSSYQGDISIDDISFENCPETNFAFKKQTWSRKAVGKSERAVNGNTKNCFYSYFIGYPWWKVDLGNETLVSNVSIYHNSYACRGSIQNRDIKHRFPCWQINSGYEVYLSSSFDNWKNPSNLCYRSGMVKKVNETVRCNTLMSGRYLIIHLPYNRDKNELILCEVKVFGILSMGKKQTEITTPQTTVAPRNFVPICTFSRDFCGWSHDISGHFMWTRHNKSTPSFGTGPRTDHSGDGVYAYAEGSSPRKFGEKARMTSPVMTVTSSQCLSYWYHMYGKTIYELNVYIKSPSSSFDLATLIANHQGHVGNKWVKKVINLELGINPFVIVFEAVRGVSYTSDIAIDDVGIIHCNIALKTTPTTATTSISTSATTNRFTTSPKVYKCPALASPVLGTVTPAECTSSSSDPGKVCSISCPTGHTVVGQPKVTCNTNGQWSSSLATACRDIQAPKLVCPKDIVATAHRGLTSANVSWTTPTASDNSGRHPKIHQTMTPPVTLQQGSYPVMVTATDEFNNKAMCMFSIHVKVMSCSNPVMPPNLRLTGSSCYNYYGESCTVACAPGYKLMGLDTITCEKYHQHYKWSIENTVCKVADTNKCQGLVAGPHSSLSTSKCLSAADPGTQCSIICDRGFTQYGQNILTCLNTGHWSSDVASLSCIDKDPPSVVCKDISVTVPKGHSLVVVTWPEPKTIDSSGLPVTVTQSIHSPATLSEGEHHVSVQATDQAGNIGHCTFTIEVKVKKCGTPNLKSNMKVKGTCQSIYGSTCTLVCEEGYKLKGSGTITCGDDMKWIMNNVECEGTGSTTGPKTGKQTGDKASGSSSPATVVLIVFIIVLLVIIISCAVLYVYRTGYFHVLLKRMRRTTVMEMEPGLGIENPNFEEKVEKEM